MEKSLGYGQASYNIYKSLQALGVEVGINLPKADIELCFSHPMEHVFNDPDSYKIAYSAWESTDLHFHWKKNMLRGDEIWGTSDWVSDVWKILFPTKTIFTYKHGINSDWKPKLRTSRQKQFTFLHIGEPFSRKDAQLVTDCFIELYGNNSDYRLVMKANGMNTVKVPHPEYGYLSSPSACYDNIITIDSFLTDEQMVGLYEQCDVFIYPSWGEGWGLQPMQALASGMPVISTDGWADYSKYITWAVKSNWLNSPWQDIHPGMMMKPNKTSLLEAMKNADEQYDSILKDTFKNAFKMHAEYDWLEVTKPAVARLREIYAKRVLEGKNLKA
jgi:glycosyltransferase involved in cell wall biosynthesis